MVEYPYETRVRYGEGEDGDEFVNEIVMSDRARLTVARLSWDTDGDVRLRLGNRTFVIWAPDIPEYPDHPIYWGL